MSDISSKLGITGVEEGHISDALKKQDIDPSVVDWQTIGGDISDYSNRYEATWDRLESMYGISPPTEWRYSEVPKYRQQEYEFNAENLSEEMQHEGVYTKVMNALCYGRGDVPPEIEEAIGYKGKKREEFIKTLCSGYKISSLSEGYSHCVSDIGGKVVIDRSCMKKVADDAGISGHDGSYSKCMTHNVNSVVIDRNCMKQASTYSPYCPYLFGE